MAEGESGRVGDNPGLPAAAQKKVCCRCGEEKAIGDFWRKYNKSRPACKSCEQASNAAHRAAHLDEARARGRDYHQAHREEFNKKKVAYRQQNLAQLREKEAAYRLATRERRTIRDARWRSQNIAKVRADRARWRTENPEKMRAARRKWAEQHSDRLAAYLARRRAQCKTGSPEDAVLIDAFYAKVRSAKKIRCYWCGEFVPKGKRQVDHIIPLWGKEEQGAHASWNLCCACPKCNRRKGAKDPAEFGGQGELYLLPEKKGD